MRIYAAIAAALMATSISFVALLSADAYAAPKAKAEPTAEHKAQLKAAEAKVVSATIQVAQAEARLAQAKASLKTAKGELSTVKARGRLLLSEGRVAKLRAYEACLSEVDAPDGEAHERCAGELE